MTARYICIEGAEGVGKTTQTARLVEHLQSKGYKVLQTKEPGTPLSPLTMEMRKLMLDAQFDKEMTQSARELISQGIRSIHVERVIIPALEEYDFIVQDRGILSGLAYGEACGNDIAWLKGLALKVVAPLLKALNKTAHLSQVYDTVLYLTTGDIAGKLNVAKSAKQEFESGDAIEAKGSSFMEQVAINFDKHLQQFNGVKIDVDGKNIEQVFDTITASLRIK